MASCATPWPGTSSVARSEASYLINVRASGLTVCAQIITFIQTQTAVTSAELTSQVSGKRQEARPR
jgi:hypothetical protein